MVMQRHSVFKTFLITQKEVAPHNPGGVLELMQLTACWTCSWSILVHITFTLLPQLSLVRMSCSSLMLRLILVIPWVERSMLEEKVETKVIRGSWLYFTTSGPGLGTQRRSSTRWPNCNGKGKYSVTVLTICFLAVFSEMTEIVKTAFLSSGGWEGPAWLPVTMVGGTFSSER